MNQGNNPHTLVGSFTWDVDDDHWWWSDELFVIHGFEPGEVIPTTDLWLAHKHPEDIDKVKHSVEGALVHRDKFGCYHRILDARRRERHVLLAGNTEQDGDDLRLRGFVADLTSARAHDLQPAIDDAIGEMMVNRATIEQAKGAIMLAYGITPTAAFEILRTASQNGNTKVHELAERLVEMLAKEPQPPGDHTVLDRVLAEATWPDAGRAAR